MVANLEVVMEWTLERLGKCEGYVETPKMREENQRLLERLVISAFVEFDKAHNWPRIEAEMGRK